MPPPRVSPDTPTDEIYMVSKYSYSDIVRKKGQELQSKKRLTRPPGTSSPYCSIHGYTSCHRFPGPIEAIFLSDDSLLSFNFSNAIVIPPSMLDPPAKAACPPPFTANGHCVSLDTKTAAETCTAVAGLNTQKGLTTTCWPAQYALVKFSYVGLPSDSTLVLPKVI